MLGPRGCLRERLSILLLIGHRFQPLHFAFVDRQLKRVLVRCGAVHARRPRQPPRLSGTRLHHRTAAQLRAARPSSIINSCPQYGCASSSGSLRRTAAASCGPWSHRPVADVARRSSTLTRDPEMVAAMANNDRQTASRETRSVSRSPVLVKRSWYNSYFLDGSRCCFREWFFLFTLTVRCRK